MRLSNTLASMTSILGALVLTGCASAQSKPSSSAVMNDLAKNLIQEMIVQEIPAIGPQKAKDCQSLFLLVAGLAVNKSSDVADLSDIDVGLGVTVLSGVWQGVLSREAAAAGIKAGSIRSEVITDIVKLNVGSDDVSSNTSGNLRSTMMECTDILKGAATRAKASVDGLSARSAASALRKS